MLLLICFFNFPWRHILRALSQIPAVSIQRGLSAALAQGDLGGGKLPHCLDLAFIATSTFPSQRVPHEPRAGLC